MANKEIGEKAPYKAEGQVSCQAFLVKKDGKAKAELILTAAQGGGVP